MSSFKNRPPQDIGVPPRTPPVGPGSQTVEIEALAAGGRGVARVDGAVWFVDGGLPGDRVLAKPFRSKSRFHEATVSRLLEPSPDRRTPPCTYQARCGGCPWMPLPEALQQDWKRRLVVDALQRIARLDAPTVRTTIAVGEPFGYRGRIELSLGRNANGRPALGYRAAGLPGAEKAVVDVDSCAVADARIAAVLPKLREVLLDPEGPVYDALVHAPRKLRVHLRSGSEGVVVALVDDNKPFPEYRLVAGCLVEVEGIAGVVRLTYPGQRRGGVKIQSLEGANEVVETMAGKPLRLPVVVFTQVHREAADAMTDQVLQFAGDLEGKRFWDLYGGVGRYAAAAVERGATRALVCEADPGAVAAGRRAFGDRVDFVELPTETFLRTRRELPGESPQPPGGVQEPMPPLELEPPDVTVANPPRSGLGADVVSELRRVGAARLILISCDPATLARDLRGLLEEGLYRLEEAVPFELFPQTAHIETVALLVRNEQAPS